MATVTFYRLVKTAQVGNALDGFGARLYGGRWNSRGTACVYLGSSKSRCVLELLVHLTIADLAHHYSLLSLAIPDDLIAELDNTALPQDWRHDPAPASTQAIGDGWLSDVNNGLVLKVPSTLTGEWNALFNPQHPAAQEVRNTVQVEPFDFDPRLALT